MKKIQYVIVKGLIISAGIGCTNQNRPITIKPRVSGVVTSINADRNQLEVDTNSTVYGRYRRPDIRVSGLLLSKFRIKKKDSVTCFIKEGTLQDATVDSIVVTPYTK